MVRGKSLRRKDVQSRVVRFFGHKDIYLFFTEMSFFLQAIHTPPLTAQLNHPVSQVKSGICKTFGVIAKRAYSANNPFTMALNSCLY